jgi:hypothetical protein
MSAATDPRREELVSLVTGLVERAAAGGTALRALGGLGIDLRASGADPRLRRSFADVDLAAPKKARRQVTELMVAAGLQAEPEFNALQGARRHIWWTPDRSTHVDIFLGEFAMCHRLMLDERLGVDHPALPAADLLLMKLQIVELNHKDVIDLAALLTTHTLGNDDADGSINRHRIVDVLSADWGFYTTTGDNLERIPGLVSEIDGELGRRVEETTTRLQQEIDEAPKSRAFKLRAKVGRRKRWYEVPEDSIT